MEGKRAGSEIRLSTPQLFCIRPILKHQASTALLFLKCLCSHIEARYILKMSSHYVAQNSLFSCLSLPRAEIAGMYYHDQLVEGLSVNIMLDGTQQ